MSSDCHVKFGTRSKAAKWHFRLRNDRHCLTSLSPSTSPAERPSNTSETSPHGSPIKSPPRANRGTTAAPARSTQDRHDGDRCRWCAHVALLHVQGLPDSRREKPPGRGAARLGENRVERHGRAKAIEGTHLHDQHHQGARYHDRQSIFLGTILAKNFPLRRAECAAHEHRRLG